VLFHREGDLGMTARTIALDKYISCQNNSHFVIIIIIINNQVLRKTKIAVEISSRKGCI